jgi:hypothetical protein
MFKKAMILSLLLLSQACSLKSQEAPYEDVDKAATLFFERLKASKYDQIYSDSAKSFQESNAKPEVIGNLRKMAELGKPEPPVRMTMSYNNEGGKRIAMPNYSVLFINSSAGELKTPDGQAVPGQTKATVILKFIDDGGEWKLGAFEVRQRSG